MQSHPFAGHGYETRSVHMISMAWVTCTHTGLRVSTVYIWEMLEHFVQDVLARSLGTYSQAAHDSNNDDYDNDDWSSQKPLPEVTNLPKHPRVVSGFTRAACFLWLETFLGSFFFKLHVYENNQTRFLQRASDRFAFGVQIVMCSDNICRVCKHQQSMLVRR